MGNSEIIVIQELDRYLQGAEFNRKVYDLVMNKLVDAVVDKIVESKMNEVLAAVKPEAIANLALSKAANRIADELGKK